MTDHTTPITPTESTGKNTTDSSNGSGNKIRCGINGCKKNIDLLSSKCKCGKLTCFGHRDPMLHKCTFDYKGSAQKELTEKLIKVGADRMGNRV
jgi:hypothetical protein